MDGKMPLIDNNEILVLGGSGFIGSHLVRALQNQGADVTVVDSFEAQVHGTAKTAPESKNVRVIRGRISDAGVLPGLIGSADAIVHLAAAVGVGQSMYRIREYVEKNTADTAALLDSLVNEKNRVRKLVIASSMSVYGEGQYTCGTCGEGRYPVTREYSKLDEREWEHSCPKCNNQLNPVPTVEDKPLNPSSVYAMSKRHQEELSLLVGKTVGIPTVALRLFNTYGPGQSLSNPYTGACAIFSSRILNHKSPYIFEDGGQLRDFVHVSDVVDAILLALGRSQADYRAINIGTGIPTSILDLAGILAKLYDRESSPFVSGEYRKGDIRHCFASIDLAHKLLGFNPKTRLEDGLVELAKWARRANWGAADAFDKSLSELKQKRLA